MSPGARGAALTALALAAAIASGSQARAETGYSLRSFSQGALFTVPDPAELRSQCQSKPVKGGLTFSQAMSKTSAFLRQSASSGALSAVARSPVVRDPRQARILVGAALLDDKPGAALATLF